MRPILFFLLFVSTSAAAEQRYVSDELSINLRKGQGTQFQILSMLKSGTAVDVLEEDAESGYSRVRSSSGREGWVLTRFLSRQPVARVRIASAEKRLEQTRAEIRELRESLRQAINARDETELDRSALETENAALRNQMDDLARSAAKPLALEAENQQLKIREKALEQELSDISHAHDLILRRREHILVGAGILIFGMIIGLVVPRLGRRKSAWDGLG